MSSRGDDQAIVRWEDFIRPYIQLNLGGKVKAMNVNATVKIDTQSDPLEKILPGVHQAIAAIEMYCLAVLDGTDEDRPLGVGVICSNTKGNLNPSIIGSVMDKLRREEFIVELDDAKFHITDKGGLYLAGVFEADADARSKLNKAISVVEKIESDGVERQ